jgi:beta-galactosidase/beta-glucuronidase
MKKLIFSLTIILVSVSNSFSQYIPVPAGSSISLNGSWKFNPAPDKKIFSSSEFHSGWKDIKVPGEWTMQGKKEREPPIRRDLKFLKNGAGKG